MSEHRHLPHLRSFVSQPIVFLTVVTEKRRPCLACAPAFKALTSIWLRSPESDGWFVGDYLLMPDHVHLFARAAYDSKSLAQWMKAWKSVSSRELSAALRLKGPFWQRDYFDRYLRSADNYAQKWDYVAMNPVRGELCEEPGNWPWRGRLNDLRF